jgi:hypothetical protein
VQNRKQNINERTPELAENTKPFFAKAPKAAISVTEIAPTLLNKATACPELVPAVPVTTRETESHEARP